MEKILVTGSNGFVGKHLMQEIASQEMEPVGLSREGEPVPENQDFKYLYCDLSDEESVKQISLDGVRAIINLAGLAAVGPSFDNPDLYMKVNVEVLTNLCAYIEENDRKDIRIIAVSSGAVYDSQQPLPLHENSKLDPDSSPYAASKIAMEEAAAEYRNRGVDCVVVRPFNHIGPGQAPGFLLPDLLEKIKNLPDGENTIKVGNISTERDYTDVRDVAKAYVSLAVAKELKESVFNVCTGRSVPGEKIFQILKKALEREELIAEKDEKLYRPSDSPILYGDNSHIQKEAGWQPTIPLEQTIRDFVASA